MKLLQTTQQTELKEFLEVLRESSDHLGEAQLGLLNYWIQELKPKRVRRKLAEAA